MHQHVYPLKIWYLQCKSIIRFQEIDQSFKHQGTFPLTNTYRMKYYGTWRRSTRIVMCILIFLLNVHEMDQANFAVWCKGSLTLLKFWMKFLIFYFKTQNRVFRMFHILWELSNGNAINQSYQFDFKCESYRMKIFFW